MMSDDEECHLYIRDQNQPYLPVVAGVKSEDEASLVLLSWMGMERQRQRQALDGTHALHCTADVCTCTLCGAAARDGVQSTAHTHTHT